MPHVIRDGQRIAFATLGSGPDTVLLAHNLMSRRGSFAAVAARLAPRCRLLAVDLRGHGESGDAPRSFAAQDLADDLLAVLDAVGVTRALLVGTSLGATAAALLTLAHPQRVRGLMLLSATALAASRADRLRFAALATVIRALGPGPVMPAILGQLLGARYRAQEPAGAARAAAQIRATARGDLVRAIAAWVGRPPLPDRLAQIEVPTKIVVGDQDTACPRARGEALAAGLPHASLHVVHGAGHSLQLEHPEAVAALIEQFLATLPA
ncbi:MAG: alpha/beta fold hydrolase [Nannocystis sp.]|nr:alpha/beta fold hydrolase [Nannocystis sp.]MBA3547788.1 alpha/beta fold hydrolase [Nannocystis sp.]